MPYHDVAQVSGSSNRLIAEELSYDINKVKDEFEKLHGDLTPEQHGIFNEIKTAVNYDKGGVFFVYGYGGPERHLWKTLSSCIRSEGKIVLNVASSGIASLLLAGGRTAHSRFHIPLNLNETFVCHIKPNSDAADLIKRASLIIWDEAPMVHKHGFEAFDRTLRDVLQCEEIFGGKVVFGGDFRQILPIVPNGSRQDIVDASLTSSYIWNSCKVLTLTKNMRLTVRWRSSNAEQLKVFAKWLLDVGEGKLGDSIDGESIIDIPEDLIIKDSSDPISKLIDFVYPDLQQNFTNSSYFQERAILAPTNEVVHEINDRLLSMLPVEEKEYLSSDFICVSEAVNRNIDPSLYSPDVLNGLKISGTPNHQLRLKVGAPVMLLRNIDKKGGLCNGTRLKIVALGTNVIEAKVMTGTNIDERVFFPRINITPSDKKIPIKFQRRHFPISVCFAMIVNKSQGQSLSKVGLYLRQPVFSHGQLYVALSRVQSREGLKMLIIDKDNHVSNKTKNVVYKEVFSNM